MERRGVSDLRLDPTRVGATYEAAVAVVHPEDRALVETAYRRSLEAKTPYEFQHRLLFPDGRIKYVRALGRPEYDEHGTPIRSIGTLQDITTQVEAEQRLLSILDAMLAFVGLFALDETVLEVNRAPLDVAGLTRRDVIGQRFWDTYWWSYSEACQAEIRALMARAAGGETVRFDMRARVGDQRFITVDNVLAPLRDSAGRIQGVVGSGIDISERVAAEREIRRARDLLRTVVDSSPDWIFAKDLEHRFLLVNEAFARAHGSRPEQMIGRPDTDFLARELCDGGAAAGVRGLRAHDRAAFAGVQVRDPNDSRTTASGEVLVSDIWKGPLRDEQGAIYGLFAYGRDVTEERRAQQALRRASTPSSNSASPTAPPRSTQRRASSRPSLTRSRTT